MDTKYYNVTNAIVGIFFTSNNLSMFAAEKTDKPAV